MKILRNRRLKKLQREKKWSDPYSIDKLSDNDFLQDVSKYRLRSVLRIVLGFVLVVIAFVLLAMLWGDIFYSERVLI